MDHAAKLRSIQALLLIASFSIWMTLVSCKFEQLNMIGKARVSSQSSTYALLRLQIFTIHIEITRSWSKRLGIEDCFDQIICFETMNPTCLID
uniref:Uncharacterized protein n=1 Tax=Salix viminalis TaxID=40686 RepID=A0A6N2NE08_SALVM